MTSHHTTEGIRALIARPLPQCGGQSRWRVTFRSDWPGLCHQLYANGRLVAWTDSPEQRSFIVDAGPAAQELTVAACPARLCTVDAGGLLGLTDRAAGWVWRGQAVVGPTHQPGDRVEVLDQDATALAGAELRPPWGPLWSFGQDVFGRGGFGFDGALAPGLGRGAFAAGQFGLDACTVELTVPLRGEGARELTVRTLRAGAASEMATITVLVASPPPPAVALTFIAYDCQADRAVFSFEKG